MKTIKDFEITSEVAEAYWSAWRKVYEDKQLTKGDLVLLMVLRDTNNDVNFHKQETLSKMTGLTRRWIRTCLYKLAGLGYITIEKKSIRSLLYVRLKEELKSPIKLIINTTRVYEASESIGSTVPIASEVQFPSDRNYSSPDNGEHSKRELQTDSGSNFSQYSGTPVTEVVGNNAEGAKRGGASSQLDMDSRLDITTHALQLFPDWKEAEFKKALADYTGKATAEDLIKALDKLKGEKWDRGFKSVKHFFEDKSKRIEQAITNRKQIEDQKVEDEKLEAKYEAQRAEEAKLRKEREEAEAERQRLKYEAEKQQTRDLEAEWEQFKTNNTPAPHFEKLLENNTTSWIDEGIVEVKKFREDRWTIDELEDRVRILVNNRMRNFSLA